MLCLIYENWLSTKFLAAYFAIRSVGIKMGFQRLLYCFKFTAPVKIIIVTLGLEIINFCLLIQNSYWNYF